MRLASAPVLLTPLVHRPCFRTLTSVLNKPCPAFKSSFKLPCAGGSLFQQPGPTSLCPFRARSALTELWGSGNGDSALGKGPGDGQCGTYRLPPSLAAPMGRAQKGPSSVAPHYPGGLLNVSGKRNLFLHTQTSNYSLPHSLSVKKILSEHLLYVRVHKTKISFLHGNQELQQH